VRSILAAALRGYFAALGAGNAAFWLAGLIRAAVSGTIEENASIAGFLIVALFTFIVSLVTTVFPFILFFAISRIARVRGWPYFVLCGMAMGVVTTAMLIGARWTEWQLWALNASLCRHLIVAGGCGGFAFWWVAVRRAGRPQPL
jgi:hypothetical protein